MLVSKDNKEKEREKKRRRNPNGYSKKKVFKYGKDTIPKCFTGGSIVVRYIRLTGVAIIGSSPTAIPRFVISFIIKVIRAVYNTVSINVLMVMRRISMMVMVFSGFAVYVTSVNSCVTGMGECMDGKEKENDA